MVGISDNTRHGGNNVIIHLVKLARLPEWHKKVGDLLLFASKDNSILGENSNNRSILVDVLDGVLNLEQSSIGVEGSGSSIVLSRLSKLG